MAPGGMGAGGSGDGPTDVSVAIPWLPLPGEQREGPAFRWRGLLPGIGEALVARRSIV